MEVLGILLILVGGAALSGEFSMGNNTVQKEVSVSEPAVTNKTLLKSQAVIEPKYIVHEKEEYVIANVPSVPTLKTPYVERLPHDTRKPLAIKKTLPAVVSKTAKSEVKSCINDSFKVHFDHNRFNLKPDAVEVINQAISVAKSCGVKKAVVQGHATIDGNIHYNIKLATKRAHEVKKFLEYYTSMQIEVLNPLTAKDTIKPERFAQIKFKE